MTEESSEERKPLPCFDFACGALATTWLVVDCTMGERSLHCYCDRHAEFNGRIWQKAGHRVTHIHVSHFDSLLTRCVEDRPQLTTCGWVQRKDAAERKAPPPPPIEWIRKGN